MFYGQYEDLIIQYEVPISRKVHAILEDNYMQCNPIDQTLQQFVSLLPNWTSLPYLTFHPTA